MSQLWRQQDCGEISLIRRERERQQENGNSDFEKQSGSQLDELKEASMFNWHWKLIVLFGISVLCVDPLFLYIPVINQVDKCLKLDKRLMRTALCLRSFFDMIYIGNIILGYFSRRQGRTGLNPDDQQPRQIIKRYLRSYFAIDILALLPIPQVLVPIFFLKTTRTKILRIRTMLLNLFVLLQYVPRVLRIYLSWRKHIMSFKYARRVWIKVLFNIFLYILASHVLGGFWYFFSIERETFCWHIAYDNHKRNIPSSFKCDPFKNNITLIDDTCPIQTPNTTIFNFGIFLEALQSGIVSSENIPEKIMHCFWWGFRNLSSLGQNLQTSTYFWENCFATFISIYGLLMLLYFIGNAQIYLQKANEEAAEKAKKLEEIERKMGLIKTEIESWMATNQFSNDMKAQIITCIRQKLEANKDFDTERPFSYISKELMTKMRIHLCLPLLKKVPNLENHGENLAERICESLKPKYYNEDSYILREREPLMMLIITQGSACCFKPSNGENGKGIDSDTQYIEKGDLYGEELLEWAFNRSSSHKKPVPISNKTVKTHSKVLEVFTLTANDLKHLVPMHTRAAFAAKRVFQNFTEKKNENSPKMENPRAIMPQPRTH